MQFELIFKLKHDSKTQSCTAVCEEFNITATGKTGMELIYDINQQIANALPTNTEFGYTIKFIDGQTSTDSFKVPFAIHPAKKEDETLLKFKKLAGAKKR